MLDRPDVVGGATQTFNGNRTAMRASASESRSKRPNTRCSATSPVRATPRRRAAPWQRALSKFDQGGIIALLLLEQTSCDVLTASGQAQIIVEHNGDKPGYITADTSATGGSGSHACNNNNRWAIDAVGTQNSRIVAEGSTSSGLPGIIRMYTLAPGQGNAKAYEPADVEASRLAPAPLAASRRIGRNPIDWRWNCSPLGHDGIGGTTDDCRLGFPAYLNNLKTAIGTTGAPVGFQTYPPRVPPVTSATSSRVTARWCFRRGTGGSTARAGSRSPIRCSSTAATSCSRMASTSGRAARSRSTSATAATGTSTSATETSRRTRKRRSTSTACSSTSTTAASRWAAGAGQLELGSAPRRQLRGPRAVVRVDPAARPRRPVPAPHRGRLLHPERRSLRVHGPERPGAAGECAVRHPPDGRQRPGDAEAPAEPRPRGLPARVGRGADPLTPAAHGSAPCSRRVGSYEFRRRTRSLIGVGPRSNASRIRRSR